MSWKGLVDAWSVQFWQHFQCQVQVWKIIQISLRKILKNSIAWNCLVSFDLILQSSFRLNGQIRILSTDSIIVQLHNKGTKRNLCSLAIMQDTLEFLHRFTYGIKRDKGNLTGNKNESTPLNVYLDLQNFLSAVLGIWPAKYHMYFQKQVWFLLAWCMMYLGKWIRLLWGKVRWVGRDYFFVTRNLSLFISFRGVWYMLTILQRVLLYSLYTRLILDSMIF